VAVVLDKFAQSVGWNLDRTLRSVTASGSGETALEGTKAGSGLVSSLDRPRNPPHWSISAR